MERKRDDKVSRGARSETGVMLPCVTLPRKHDCPDCRFCQLCSDSRCSACRGEKATDACSGMSFSEQIRLYEELNANDPAFKKKRA